MALVIHGSTGWRLSITKAHLAKPSTEELKSRHKSDALVHFMEKQWAAVASHWYTRLTKEEKLRMMELPDLMQKIEADIVARFEKKREAQQLHKKRKRLLENTNPDTGAGLPTNTVLVVNFVSLRTFLKDKPYSDAVVELIVDEASGLVGHAGGGVDSEGDSLKGNTVTTSSSRPRVGFEILVDSSDDAATENCGNSNSGGAPLVVGDDDAGAGAPPPEKQLRVEVPSLGKSDINAEEGVGGDGGSGPGSQSTSNNNVAPSVAFDDRVALLLRCESPEDAAMIIAKLHGRVLDGRSIVCRFY